MSIPFYPPSLSTCVLWLDASDPTSLTVAEDRVSAWQDKSPFQNNTTIASVFKPLLSNLNSLSSVLFHANTGLPQFLQGPLSSFQIFSSFSTNFYLTTFAVATVSTTSVVGFFPTLFSAGLQTRDYASARLVQWSTPQANISVFPTSTSNSNYTELQGFNEPFLVVNTAYHDAISAYSYLATNGNPLTRSIGLLGSGSRSFAYYSLGAGAGSTTDFRDGWTGHLGELLLYATPTPIPWAERQFVEGYLASKWNLQSNLPANHPYKEKPIFISSQTSAVYLQNTTNSKNVVLPSAIALSTQLVWTLPTNQTTFVSSVAYIANCNEFIGLSNSLVLSETAQSALLVNDQTSKNWIVHSKATNTQNLVCTLPVTPYVQYPRTFSRIVGRQYQSVAISSNGDIIAGGNSSASGPVGVQGGLEIYLRNAASDLYSTIQTMIYPSDTPITSFGSKVDMSQDGLYIAVGASNFRNAGFSALGAVYLYKKDTTSDLWTQIQRLDPPVLDQRRNLVFGKELAVSSDGTFIFAAGNPNGGGFSEIGAVYPFKKTAGSDFWTALPVLYNPAPKTASSYADTISITSNSQYLVVGDSTFNYKGNTNRGCLYIYSKDPISDMWNIQQQIVAFDNYPTQRFAYQVAISLNSSYIVATSIPTERRVYVYKKSSTTDFWDFTTNLIVQFPPYFIPNFDSFGRYELCLNETGDYIFVSDAGGGRRGHLFLYQKDPSTDMWQQRNIFYSSDQPYANDDDFSVSVAIVPSAERFVVGAPFANLDNLYIYKQSTIGIELVQNTYTFVNTSNPTKQFVLPHPSSVPGQMFYIKDAASNATLNPICLSTSSNSYINNTITNYSFYQQNACLQLQSDGLSNYRIVNLFSGEDGAQPLSSGFRSFWVQGSPAGAVSSYALPLLVGTSLTNGLPSRAMLNQNIFFKDSDNKTLLPFWRQSNWGDTCNAVFWVKFPYIPAYPMERQFFLCWNCNSLYSMNAESTFVFFDDFIGGNGTAPDSNKWTVSLQGSASAALNGVDPNKNLENGITLVGVDSTNANAGILTNRSFLSNGFAINFQASYSASTFTTLAFATTNTIQFLPTGEQSNWAWTTLGNGYSLTNSNLTRRVLYSQATGAAPIHVACNTANWAPLTRFFDYQLSYTNLGNIIFTCNIFTPPFVRSNVLFQSTNTTFLESTKYLFVSQGSSNTLAARSTILEFIFMRPYVSPEPIVEDFEAITSL